MLKKYYLSLLIGLSFCQSLSASEEFSIEKLPKTVVSNIVSFLHVKDALNLFEVNKKLNHYICKEPSAYQKTSANNLVILDFDPPKKASYVNDTGAKILYTTWDKIKNKKSCEHILKYYIGAIKNANILFSAPSSDDELCQTMERIIGVIQESKNVLSIEFSSSPKICFMDVDFRNCEKVLSLIQFHKDVEKITVVSCNLSISSTHIHDFFKKLSILPRLKSMTIELSELEELWEENYPRFLTPMFECQSVLLLGSNNLGKLRNKFLNQNWDKINSKEIVLRSNSLYLLGDSFPSIRWPNNLKSINLRENELNKIKEHLIFNNLPKSLERINLKDNNLDKETIENIKNQLQENGFIIDKLHTKDAYISFQNQN